MKAKIESAKAGRTFEGSNGTVQVYEVVSGGVIYDCLNKKIMELIGQEVEFEVKKATDSRYHDTMKFGQSGPQTGSKFGGKGFQLAYGQTMEGEKLRAKTMILSYAKDLVVQQLTGKPDLSFPDCLANISTAFSAMGSLLQLDQLKDVQPASQGNGQKDHKDLAALLAEMKAMTSLETMGNWWKSIAPSYNALNENDQKTLVAEKDKKKAGFAGAGIKDPPF